MSNMKSTAVFAGTPVLNATATSGVIASGLLVSIPLFCGKKKRCSEGDCLILKPYFYNGSGRISVRVTGLSTVLDRCMEQGFANGYMTITAHGGGNKKRYLEVVVHVEAIGAGKHFECDVLKAPLDPDGLVGSIPVPCVKGMFIAICRVKTQQSIPAKMANSGKPAGQQQIAA